MLTGNGGAGYSFDGPLTDDDEKKIGIMGGMWMLDKRRVWGDPVC